MKFISSLINRRFFRRIPLILLFLVIFSATALAANGSISGKITDKTTHAPLTGANVVIVGTSLGSAADAEGNYKIDNVPIGTYTLQITYIGYPQAARTVKVEAGINVVADFEMMETGIMADALVISASRRAEKLTDAPASIGIISARAIDEFPAFNPGELAAYLKGVDYVRAGVLGTGLNIRGFNSAFNSKNLQMNDARLSTLVATGLPLGAMSTTVKEDIERVELILGPAAVLYGPNAHNGLVNTITKDPRYSEGTTFALGGGNQSVFSGRLRHAKVFNDKLAFKISAEYTRGSEFAYTDTVYSADGNTAYDELLLDRDFDSMRGESALYYSLKPGTDLILAGGYSNSNNLGITNAGRNQIKDWQVYWGQVRYVSPHIFAQVYNTWSKTEDTYAINQRTRNYWSFKNAGFSEEESLRRSLHEEWNTYYGIGLNRESNFKDDSRRINGEIQYNNNWSGFEVIVGGQWQRDIADSKGTYLLDANGAIELDQTGLYTQIEKQLADTGLKFMLAMRADDHELYGANFLPKAAILYSKPGSGTWRVTYGRGIAAPSILNLSANIFGGLLLGNGDGFTLSDGSKIKPLEVETINSYEIGYKGIINTKLFIDVNAYYNMSENFLSPALNIANAAGGVLVTHRGDQPIEEIGLPAFVLTYLNFGKVNTFGFDLGLNYYINDYYSLMLNYSYFNYDLDENDPLNDGNRDGKVTPTDLPINSPKNKFSVGLNMRKNKYFGNVFARWVQAYDFFSGINVAAADAPDLIIGGDPVLENARVGRDFNEGPLGDFLNVDLSFGYHLSPKLSIGAHVTNLFDTKVREFVASPVIGRLISGEIKFKF